MREDFNNELAAIDKKALIKLKDDISAFSGNQESELWGRKEEIENFLIKFIRYIAEFEHFKLEESRKIELKKQELRLDAKHDWADKFRLFFFRVLASTLFVITLFAMGYIEKKYDWATLPLSKYVKPASAISAK